MLRGVIAGCQCSNEGLARQRCEAAVVRCGYHQSGSDTVGTWAGINARNVSNFGTVAVVVVYLCVRALCFYWQFWGMCYTMLVVVVLGHLGREGRSWDSMASGD